MKHFKNVCVLNFLKNYYLIDVDPKIYAKYLIVVDYKN